MNTEIDCVRIDDITMYVYKYRERVSSTPSPPRSIPQHLKLLFQTKSNIKLGNSFSPPLIIIQCTSFKIKTENIYLSQNFYVKHFALHLQSKSEFKRFLIGYRDQDIKIKDTPHKSSEFCLIVCLIITHETLERFASNLD